MVFPVISKFNAQLVKKSLSCCARDHVKCTPGQVNVLSAKNLCMKQNHKDRLSNKPFIMYNCLIIKQEITDNFGGSQI